MGQNDSSMIITGLQKERSVLVSKGQTQPVCAEGVEHVTDLSKSDLIVFGVC